MHNLVDSQDLAQHFSSSVIAKSYVLLYLSHQNRSFFSHNIKVSFLAGNLIRITRKAYRTAFFGPPAADLSATEVCGRQPQAKQDSPRCQFPIRILLNTSTVETARCTNDRIPRYGRERCAATNCRPADPATIPAAQPSTDKVAIAHRAWQQSH